MYWLRIIAVFLLVALVRATIVPALEVGRAAPDLLLLVAIHVAVREPLQKRWRWSAFWVGWAAGLMVDLYSPGSHLPLGVTALVFGLVTMAMSKLGEELYLDSAVAQILIVGPVCLLAHGVLGVVLMVHTGVPASVVLGAALGAACYSGLVAPLVFAALRPLEKFLGIRSRRSFGRA